MPTKYLGNVDFNGENLKVIDLEARGLIQDNTNEIASVKAKANLNEQKINALTPRVDTLEDAVEDLDERLDVAESDIDNLEVHIAAAEEDIDNLEDDVNALTNRMTSAEGNIDALTSRMNTAENDIDTLQEDVSELTEVVNDHADLINDLTADVDSLEDRMDAVEAKNTEQDQKIAELDEEIVASTYEAGIGIYFGQGVEHTNINVEDELLDEIHASTQKNIEQDTRLTNIENGTTKLPYGKALSVTPNGNDKNLNLLDPNNNVLSSVQLPKSGTQLKYDDEGTLTNIDEATLGTGLEYDDTTDTINCTVAPGTKIRTPAVTYLRLKVTSGYTYESYGSTYINPTTMYDADTSTTITNGAGIASATAGLNVGDIILIDFSDISSVIDNLAAATQIPLLYENDWDGGITINDADVPAIIANSYVYTGVITQSGAFTQLTAASVQEVYPELYLGSGLYVDSNNVLNTNNITVTNFDTNDLNSDSQCYKFTDLDATKAAALSIGSIVEVSGADGDPNVRVAAGISSILPGAPAYLNAQNSYEFLKVEANYWKLLRTYRPSTDVYFDTLYSDDLNNFLMHFMDVAEELGTESSGSGSEVPTFIPADSSGTALSYSYWAYAENDKKRIEVFYFSSTPTTYAKLIRNSGVYRPFVPVAASADNRGSRYEYNLAPVYFDGTAYVSTAPLPVTQKAIVVVYDKPVAVNYLS